MKSLPWQVRWSHLTVILILGLVLAGPYPLAAVAEDELPPVTGELPPRPPTHDLPIRERAVVDNPSTFKAGGHIELYIMPVQSGLWAEVEWQSGSGEWLVVEGWRGQLRPQGFDRWFVADPDLGKGPYRWSVYQREGGAFLTASDPFTLPADPYSTVAVSVQLPRYHNGDFELGANGDWTEFSASFGGIGTIIYRGSDTPDVPSPQAGEFAAWLGGVDSESSQLTQSVFVPADALLSYHYQILSDDFCGFDLASVLIDGTAIATYQLCFDNATTDWVQAAVDLSNYAGAYVELQFQVQTDDEDVSSFFLDDVAIANDQRHGLNGVLMEFDYCDFIIEISPHPPAAYTVAVKSPAGEISSTLTLPQGADLRDFLDSHINDRDGGNAQAELGKQLGQALFTALFKEDVRSLYYESQRIAEHSRKGVRLKVVAQTPELAQIPWELLYDPRKGEYVALSRTTPLVRYLEVAQPIRSLTVKPPLRVLGIAISPPDLVALDIGAEQHNLEVALAGLPLELVWLPGQRWQDLIEAMRSGPWHIVHFIGHADFDAQRDQGFLVFADNDGNAAPLAAGQFARLVDSHQHLHLVILNACNSARTSADSLFSATATILLQRGIPAVLAMQAQIADRAAIQFSRTFYEALSQGVPIDTAVSESRQAISIEGADAFAWCTPVLYMRTPDGRMMDFRAQQLDHPISAESAIQSMWSSMEITEISTAVTTLLTAYLRQQVAMPGQVNESVWQKAAQIYHSLKTQFIKSSNTYATQTLERFEQKPESRQAVFQELLEDLLTNDPNYAATLSTMLQDAQATEAGALFNMTMLGGEVGEIISINTLQGGLTINKGKK